MRNDFCAFILTHGRPTNVRTYRTLQKHGYTGKVFIVIDDEDATGEEYKRIYGDSVLVFSKDEIGRYTDQYDNSTDRRAILWARNACWDLARKMGYRYFIQLDDDYTEWGYRRHGKGFYQSTSEANEYHKWTMKNSLDAVFEAFVRLIETTPVKTIASAQGGDYIGGVPRKIRFKRKAMNSFVCDTNKPFLFRGRMNDDVNTYVALGRTGNLFFTDMQVQLNQLETQSNTGGMSEVYQDSGTYVKSFYTVMTAPSCTTIYEFGRTNKRLHHKINWRKTVPLILSELLKKNNSSIVKQSAVDVDTAIPLVTEDSFTLKAQTIKPIDIIKTPPSKFVHGFLNKYGSMYPINKEFAKNIINQILQHRRTSKQHPMPLPQYMLALEDKWYTSLDIGAPDYSVYDDDYYFTEAWVCWEIYSRNYLRILLKPSVYSLVENIKTIVDLGCGIGYTTAGFKLLFPNSEVIGTNIEGTKQHGFCTAMSQSFGFKMASDIKELRRVDLVFASEYFEHILSPITHLEEVLVTLCPKFLYIANSFNTRSVGHFNYYSMERDGTPRDYWLSAAKMQSAFNKTLKYHRYRRLEINAWNNKPALWVKDQ
jgi:hypothetical protein